MNGEWYKLNEDVYPFEKGTEFLVTNSDDGFYSRYAFYQGDIVGPDGHEWNSWACEQDQADYIDPQHIRTGKVIYNEYYHWCLAHPQKDNYLDYPGNYE